MLCGKANVPLLATEAVPKTQAYLKEYTKTKAAVGLCRLLKNLIASFRKPRDYILLASLLIPSPAVQRYGLQHSVCRPSSRDQALVQAVFAFFIDDIAVFRKHLIHGVPLGDGVNIHVAAKRPFA